MKKPNVLKKMSLLVVFVLVLAMAFGCAKKPVEAENPTNVDTQKVIVDDTQSDDDAVIVEDEPVDYEPIGEGEKVFFFDVMDGDGNKTGYEVSTDETTVGAALVALDLIAGEESDYGLFVTTVLGQEPTSTASGTPYWAFYINGDYAMTGVDGTDIEDGNVYSFVVETY